MGGGDQGRRLWEGGVGVRAGSLEERIVRGPEVSACCLHGLMDH
jgi:hypothetical protein